MAVPAEPVELQPMGVDDVARARGDVVHDALEAVILHLCRASAARADEVVVVDRPATDVGVIAVGQIEALEGPQLGKQLQRAEDGRSADPGPAGLRIGEQLPGREVPFSARDELDDGLAGLREPVPGGVKGGQKGGRIGRHG